MKAKARTEGMIVSESRKGLIIHDTEHDARHELPPVAALIWQHADGNTPIARLVELVRERLLPAADEETVWSALDDLADAGLLEERVTPPGAPVSRRDAIRKVGTGIAAGLVATVVGAGVAGAAGRRSKLSLGRRREMRVKSKLKSEKTQKVAAKKAAPRVTRERRRKAVAKTTRLEGTAIDRASRVRHEKLTKRALKKQVSSIRREKSMKSRLATRRPTMAERRAKLSVEKHQKLSLSHDEEAVRALTATTRPFMEKRNKMSLEKTMKKGPALHMEKLQKSGVNVRQPPPGRRTPFIREKMNKQKTPSPANRLVDPRLRLNILRPKEARSKNTRGGG